MSRLAILIRLTDGECDVSTMSRSLACLMPRLSNHLAVLRRLGLVVFRGAHGHRYYALSEEVDVRRRRPTGVELTLYAGDGSSFTVSVPSVATVMGQLRPRRTQCSKNGPLQVAGGIA
jgi:hypothetical protein